MKCETCIHFDGCYCDCEDVWSDDLDDCIYFEEE